MAIYTGYICLLVVTVCRGNGQILSATVNSNTSPPASDDNRLTTEASRSHNPQLVTATSARLASQTSAPRDGELIPSTMTPSDYGSDILTSQQTNSVHANSQPSLFSDVIISSSSEHIAITQTYQSSVHVSSVTSINDRSSVTLTSTPSLQAVSSVVSILPSAHSLDIPAQPSSTQVGSVSSSEIPGQQLTFTSSRNVDNVISSVLLIPTPSPLNFEAPSSSLPESVIRATTMESSVQATIMLASASHQQTSDLSELKQESTHPLRERGMSTVMIVDVSTGWGRFMDQVTETQIMASSHSESIPSQAPVLHFTSSVIAVSSSVVVNPSVPASTQSEVFVASQATGLVSTSSQTEQFTFTSQVTSTEIPDLGTAQISSQTSSLLFQKTESASVSSTAVILASSLPEQITEGVSVTATSVPIMVTLAVTEQQTEHAFSSPTQVSTSALSTSGEITHESTPSQAITYESSTPSSTSVPVSWSQPTTSIFVMPTRTESVSSSVPMYPASTSSTNKPPITPAHELKDCYFQLTFDVDCALILNNSLQLAEFVGGLESSLVVNLKIAKEQIKLYDPMCGSLIIHVGLTQVPYESLKHTLFSQFQQKKFEVSIMVNNQWLRLLGVKVIEIDPPTTLSPIDVADSGLDKVDLIVIIVACCICGILITIGIILCAKECYRRKYAQSFDLLEVPHVNLKLEDFTLTRIPRPKAVYGDENVTMQAFMDNSSHRIVKNNGHQDTNGNGVNSNDVHVRMKQNKDGLVVGVTGYASQKNGVTEKGAKRNNSVCSEVSHPGDPATENLLRKGGDSSTPMGAHNPIFVDDESLSNSTEEQTKKE